jgi:hypothetical protein
MRMDGQAKRFLIYAARPAPLREFIEFWEKRYFGDSEKLRTQEKLYTTNIEGPHTADTLTILFKWKSFHTTAERSNVKRNFLSRIEEARELRRQRLPGNDFLKRFCDGGPIYRIFWLHCWYPDEFPIYDQHVHRAMVYIRDGQFDELNEHSDEKKIEHYLQGYVPFFEQFRAVSMELFDPTCDGVPGRKADRALVTFGLEVKSRILREMMAAAGAS